MQEFYQRSQNDLQNIRSVDQLAIFEHEFEEDVDQFTAKLNICISYLYMQYYKHMQSLIQQDNESIDEMKEVLRVQTQKLEKVKQIQTEFEQHVTEVRQQARVVHANLLRQLPNENQKQCLSLRKIRSFHLFTADETLVGQQCAICLEDINVGRRLRRLTCDGNHAFCPGCCETWFANNNTCPLCRHVFV